MSIIPRVLLSIDYEAWFALFRHYDKPTDPDQRRALDDGFTLHAIDPILELLGDAKASMYLVGEIVGWYPEVPQKIVSAPHPATRMTVMRIRFASFRALLGAALLIPTLIGCSRPTRPVATGPGDLAVAPSAAAIAPGSGITASSAGFHPLDLGNWWHYQMVVSVTMYYPDGDPITLSQESTRSHELVCVQPYLARDYVVERQTWFEEPVFGARQYLLFRQDGSGLYEVDRDVMAVPACDGPIKGARPPPRRPRHGRSSNSRAIISSRSR